MRFTDAIDLYIGHLARAGRRPTTLASYFRLLCDFADNAGRHRDVNTLTLTDYENFLNRWVGKSPSTLASGVSLVKGFSHFLWKRDLADGHVAESLERPRRTRAEDLDVVTVDSRDVTRMFQACQNAQELLCVATAVFLGARRRALASVRRRDLDLVHGTVRFREKGGKVVTKPLPREYHQLLLAAEGHGLWKSEDDYLIPNRRPGAVVRAERSDKVIWETVKTVAGRAGVTSHVHALRAAFAVAFLEQNPDRIYALQALMGHTRIDTTTIYLRRMKRDKEMEAVRELRWNIGLPKIEPGGHGARGEPATAPSQAHETPSGFESSPLKAHTGFEPVFPSSQGDDLLLQKLASFRSTSRSRDRA